MFKSGVKMDKLQPQILLAIMVAREAYINLGRNVEFTITSLNDGKHSKNSLHYSGNAVDLRTRHLTGAEKDAVTKEIKTNLGDNFDVVLEKTHLHIEYDPHG